jgi:hypothetical protein
MKTGKEVRAEILRGMARALFVDDWARREEDRAERTGKRLRWAGKDLMDLAPRTSAHAKKAALALAQQIRKLNHNTPVEDLFWIAATTPGKHGRRAYATDFGHYLAMQSLGHGVSWFDDHPKFTLHLPHIDYYT